MAISRGRLIYNLSIIVISLVLAIILYPSTIAGFLILVCTIGVFMTLDRMFPWSKKNAMKFCIPIVVIFMLIVAVSVIMTY